MTIFFLFIIVQLFFTEYNFAAVKDALHSSLYKKYISCQDLSINAYSLLPAAIKQHNIKDTNYILHEWENICGLTEPIFRIKILLSISNHTFSENLYTKNIIDYFREYKYKIENIYRLEKAAASEIHNEVNNRRLISQKYRIRISFNVFTKEYSSILLKKVKKGSIEYLLCSFYSNNFEYLKKNILQYKYKDTKLSKYYRDYLYGTTKFRFMFDIALIQGLWIPHGYLSVLGNHLQSGLIFGYLGGLLSIPIFVKYQNSSNYYYVKNKEGILTQTNYFNGFYVGLNFNIEIYQYKNFSTGILIGGGQEEISPFEPQKSNTNNNLINFTSFNFVSGIRLKYFFSAIGNYFFIFDTTYNIVNIENPGGTNLSGNFFSVYAGIGMKFMENKNIF